ncbi:unnamed protein product, partial [Prorocentrum cordatum]
DSLPTQRRNALTIKYEGCSLEEYSMYNDSLHVPANAKSKGMHDTRSNVHRGLTLAPTDSWEIELCMGIVLNLVILPLFSEVKKLGRSLIVFKVHKSPAVCEIFFMPRDTVHATYHERMPKTLEWVDLYCCDVEVAFWAELYQPNPSGRKSKSSYLTDELCGGFGSRCSLASKLEDTHFQRMETQLNATQEESEELARKAAMRRQKKHAQKERQKAKRAEEKGEQKAAEAALKAAEEERQAKELRAARIAAPALHGVDWGQTLSAPGSRGGANRIAAPALHGVDWGAMRGKDCAAVPSPDVSDSESD